MDRESARKSSEPFLLWLPVWQCRHRKACAAAALLDIRIRCQSAGLFHHIGKPHVARNVVGSLENNFASTEDETLFDIGRRPAHDYLVERFEHEFFYRCRRVPDRFQALFQTLSPPNRCIAWPRSLIRLLFIIAWAAASLKPPASIIASSTDIPSIYGIV